jgi:hypothetical protein
MIGIRHSEAVALLAWALTAIVAADEVSMEGEAHLTGAVTAIAGDGAITLRTPLASEPIILRGDKVLRVDFSRQGEPAAQGDMLLTLVNGDMLPCEVRSLDLSTISLATSFAGDLKVPRAMIERLSLGISPERILYDGPENLDGWDSERWTSEDRALISQGPGRAARAFDLPRQFILRFRFAWRNHPNLQVALAESSEDPRGDRYVLQFTSGGIEIKRQSKADHKSLTLISVNRPAEQFAKAEVEIELRVDRAESKLQLFLNGQLESRIDDPLTSPPPGGGISFRSNAGGEGTHRISNIQLLAWDPVSDRHRAEERGDPNVDALIDDEGARYSGRLEAIRSAADGPSLFFRSPLLDKPMEIPAKEVSTVFFAKSGPRDVPGSKLQLRLHGGGRLHVERCTFADDRIHVRHPLLGDLAVNRTALLTVERPPQSNPEVEHK